MDSSMAENDRLLQHKTTRKSNSREENRNIREQEGCTAVHSRQHDRASTTKGHHGLPMVVSGSTVPSVSERCILVLRLGSRIFALDHPSWAYWACFATFRDPFGLNFILFTYYLARYM